MRAELRVGEMCTWWLLGEMPPPVIQLLILLLILFLKNILCIEKGVLTVYLTENSSYADIDDFIEFLQERRLKEYKILDTFGV